MRVLTQESSGVTAVSLILISMVLESFAVIRFPSHDRNAALLGDLLTFFTNLLGVRLKRKAGRGVGKIPKRPEREQDCMLAIGGLSSIQGLTSGKRPLKSGIYIPLGLCESTIRSRWVRIKGVRTR